MGFGCFFFPLLCSASAEGESTQTQLCDGTSIRAASSFSCYNVLEKACGEGSWDMRWLVVLRQPRGPSSPALLSCSVCLPRLPAFTLLFTFSASLFWWEGAVAQGMWQQFEEPFSSWICVLGKWWWLLGCAAVHDIVTEGIFPILWQWQLLSFWFLLNISPASKNCSTQETTVDLNN